MIFNWNKMALIAVKISIILSKVTVTISNVKEHSTIKVSRPKIKIYFRLFIIFMTIKFQIDLWKVNCIIMFVIFFIMACFSCSIIGLDAPLGVLGANGTLPEEWLEHSWDLLRKA